MSQLIIIFIYLFCICCKIFLGCNCTHKFRKFSPAKLAKQNRKIMRKKYLLKLKIVGTI